MLSYVFVAAIGGSRHSTKQTLTWILRNKIDRRPQTLWDMLPAMILLFLFLNIEFLTESKAYLYKRLNLASEARQETKSFILMHKKWFDSRTYSLL